MTLTCTTCQHYQTQSWGDGFINQQVTEEHCLQGKWEFEEPTPSPVTGCELFEFAIADEQQCPCGQVEISVCDGSLCSSLNDDNFEEF